MGHMRTYRNRVLVLGGLLLLVLLFVRIAYNNAEPYKICYSQYTLDNGYTFTNIQVCDMWNKKLEKKINESLNSKFHIMVSPWFDKNIVNQKETVIHCQSERYLSIEYIFEYTSTDNVYWHLCLTVDMQIGEIVCLDDLINIDENFAACVKNESIFKCEFAKIGFNGGAELTVEEVTKRLNTYFAGRDIDYIVNYFRKFTKDYLYGEYYYRNNEPIQNYSTFLYTEYFYLEEGRVYLREPNSENSFGVAWIEVDDIEDFLKVPKW